MYSVYWVLIAEKPVITIEPKNVTVFEGEPSLLHCVAKGMPLPSISWYRDGQLILPDPRRYTVQSTKTVLIICSFIIFYPSVSISFIFIIIFCLLFFLFIDHVIQTLCTAL